MKFQSKFPTSLKKEIGLMNVVDPLLKERDIALWRQWKRTQSPADLEALYKQMENIIHRELLKQRGSLPETYLEIEAKKFAKQAFETYDPKLGVALSTHVVNTMKQLVRLNMTYQSAVRAPEHQQRVMGEFINVRNDLKEELGRVPTHDELADRMKLNTKVIARLEEGSRMELSDSIELPTSLSTEFSVDTTSMDPTLIMFYYGLDPIDKLIFEHTTGYGGKQILGNAQLAKKLNMSYAQLSYRKSQLVARLQKKMGRA
jgi:DNA-directed RNA polymerase specialized sigma subunit